jgi:hypothetical protein
LILHVAIISFSHFSTDISLQGSDLISGHADPVRRFYDLIPGSQPVEHGFYMYPCDTNLPDIALYFGGVAFSITQDFDRGLRDEGSGNCLGSIVGNEENPMWTIGTAFMTNFYTVFDVDNRRVGFATLA